MAIELAASRVKLLQPSQIATRLEDCFKILTGGPVDALPHHQTIERAIDWSYDMLDPEQQMLFRQLSVFRGGFTLDACGAVMETEDEFEALDALGELVDKSLVRTMPAGEETRYNLLEPLRQYAAARISADEAAVADARHAGFFRDLAEKAFPEIHGPNQIEWFARLEREHDNLRAALAWGLEAGDADLAQRTAAALWWFWIVRRHVAEGVNGSTGCWLLKEAHQRPGHLRSFRPDLSALWCASTTWRGVEHRFAKPERSLSSWENQKAKRPLITTMP